MTDPAHESLAGHVPFTDTTGAPAAGPELDETEGTRVAGEGADEGQAADGVPDAEAHAASPCPVAWCPICITVSAVQPIRPDVVEHLLKAGTEMLLAFRAVVDARADDVTGAGNDEGASTKLEKIELG